MQKKHQQKVVVNCESRAKNPNQTNECESRAKNPNQTNECECKQHWNKLRGIFTLTKLITNGQG